MQRLQPIPYQHRSIGKGSHNLSSYFPFGTCIGTNRYGPFLVIGRGEMAEI